MIDFTFFWVQASLEFVGAEQVIFIGIAFLERFDEVVKELGPLGVRDDVVFVDVNLFKELADFGGA